MVRSAGSDHYNYDNPVRRDTVSIGEMGDNVTVRFVVRFHYLRLCGRTKADWARRRTTRARGSSTATSISTWKRASLSCSQKTQRLPVLSIPSRVCRINAYTCIFGSYLFAEEWEKLCPTYNASMHTKV